MVESKAQLTRGLTLVHAISLVSGIIIGSGIFLKTAVMAQQVGTPILVLLAWMVAGFLSLAGALTYAERGALLPHAGGEYIFLRTAYGDAPAFLYGWMQLTVGFAAGNAAVGIAFATFLATLLPLNSILVERTFHLLGQNIHWQFGLREIIAIGVILFLSAINCFTVAFGGRVQAALTVAKVLGVITIIGGVFFFSHGATWTHLITSVTPQWTGLKAFGAAMLAALWAYDGWSFMPMAAGEVQNPQRNLPRALIFGMLAVIVIYCLTNLAYFYALPFSEVVSSSSTMYRDAPPVATKAAEKFLGAAGVGFVSVAFLLSAIGALNGLILTSARVPFAMARDGLFFSRIGELNPSSRVPVWSVGILGVWSSILAISGSFDALTNMAMFAAWIFYAATTASVFVLRRKLAHATRPYRTLGYPVVPMLFVLIAIWLIINTLQTDPIGSVSGLVLIALGLPLYLYFRQQQNRATT